MFSPSPRVCQYIWYWKHDRSCCMYITECLYVRCLVITVKVIARGSMVECAENMQTCMSENVRLQITVLSVDQVGWGMQVYIYEKVYYLLLCIFDQESGILFFIVTYVYPTLRIILPVNARWVTPIYLTLLSRA